MSGLNPNFATTQWTLVWQAAREDSMAGRPAMGEILRRYWQPLYAYGRKQGLSSQDAEDATQEFLAEVIDGNLLQQADPAKGRFRSYLLTAWKRFLIDRYRRQNSLRRGGRQRIVSLDISEGERNWRNLKARVPDPEQVFMRSWAESLLDAARQRIREDYRRNGKAEIVDLLLPKITNRLTTNDYNQLSQTLSRSAGAVKVAVHRLRKNFAVTLRELVAQTVESEAEIDRELDELLQALSGSPAADHPT